MNLRRVVLVVCLALLLFSSTATATPSPTRVHFTAAGDYGSTPATVSVLETIAAAAPDFNLAVGDLSYGKVGGEQEWCDFVTSHVGAGFPFELVSGNHESDGMNGNINDFSACLPNQLPGVVGTYGRQYYVDVPQDQPLVRVLMISPGLTYPQGPTDYSAGSPAYEWTANAIDRARSQGIRWVVAGMHMPCLSVGRYGCASGTDIMNLLVQKKVDLVLHGHEHNYQRTKQLSLTAGCTSLTVDGYDADCVRDDDNDFTAGAGTVFQTVGTGGVPLRDLMLDDAEMGYFAATSGANVDPVFGVADFEVTPELLSVRYLPAGDGTFSDSFTLTRPATPEPNEPPVGAMAATAEGLRVTFDGSLSSDADGAVVAHRWDFGDGRVAYGANVQHAYGSSGTYDVTLTVTDDDGSTSTAVQSVTVEGVAPQLYAFDRFGRELSGTWGAADLGGEWTESNTSSVSGGVGRLSVPKAGGRAVGYLHGVTPRDVDVVVDWATEKLPTGSGASINQAFLTRRTNGGHYKALVQVSATGEIRVSMRRNIGSESLVGKVVRLPFSYAPGEVLRVRTQTVGVAPTTLRLKLWKKGTEEPTSWTVEQTDSTAQLEAPGSVGFIARLSSGVTNAPVEVWFDDYEVQPPSDLP